MDETIVFTHFSGLIQILHDVKLFVKRHDIVKRNAVLAV